MTTFNISPANLGSPVAHVQVDPVTGVQGVGACANYTAYSTNGTTVVKSGAGVYFGHQCVTAGASSNTFVIYDNTSGSGQVLFGTATNMAAGQNSTPTGVGVRFTAGLTIVMATGTAATGFVLWD